jgi:NTE family protein
MKSSSLADPAHRASPSPMDPMRRRDALRALTALPVAALAGCAAFDYSGADAPSPATHAVRAEPPPRLALVLGSGGPRGYAHLGVLRVLAEAGIVPDLVVGSSVGALIGVFWASGLDADRLDALSMQGGPLTIFDPSLFADRGWIHGQRLQDYVNAGLGGRRLEELPRRAIVVATRRIDKQPVAFSRGNAGVAVRASSAMPGIVSPVGIGGVEYEDGDESLPVPVSVARAAGARFVLAVDVSPRAGSTPAAAAEWMRQRDLRRRARIDPEIVHADALLHPELDYWAGPFRSYFVASRAAGEAAARAGLAGVLARIREPA